MPIPLPSWIETPPLIWPAKPSGVSSSSAEPLLRHAPSAPAHRFEGGGLAFGFGQPTPRHRFTPLAAVLRTVRSSVVLSTPSGPASIVFANENTPTSVWPPMLRLTGA